MRMGLCPTRASRAREPRYHLLTGFKIRRAIPKQHGGSITVPVARSNEKAKMNIKQSIEAGKYNIGVPVVDTEISKLSISKERNVEGKNVTCRHVKFPYKIL